MLNIILGLFLLVHFGVAFGMWALAFYMIVVKGERPPMRHVRDMLLVSIFPIVNALVLYAAIVNAMRELEEDKS